ncbi:hypothetical protein BUALT_Bualt03G0212700 [Buddleja alternifolia]|uniref:Uncharacterized protein n=1 Tax=Buddleja alternifolia TaxID=168488 RepID=A0AAV6XZZ2_9LAMI|nr:hypothetical protein BUALT_Bualt03G0212700 [Buddleja alternifolia]
MSGRSSDRWCCSVGASVANGTCSDFPMATETPTETTAEFRHVNLQLLHSTSHRRDIESEPLLDSRNFIAMESQGDALNQLLSDELEGKGTLCAASRDDVIHKLFTELAYRYK